MTATAIYTATATDMDGDLNTGPVFSTRETAQAYCDSVNAGLWSWETEFYNVHEHSVLTEAPAMTVSYMAVLALPEAGTSPAATSRAASSALHVIRLVRNADDTPINDLVTVTGTGPNSRTLTGSDPVQVTAVHSQMTQSMYAGIEMALSQQQAVAVLVEGIDGGHTAWVIYNAQGKKVGDPVASDRDKDAILAEFNR